MPMTPTPRVFGLPTLRWLVRDAGVNRMISYDVNQNQSRQSVVGWTKITYVTLIDSEERRWSSDQRNKERSRLVQYENYEFTIKRFGLATGYGNHILIRQSSVTETLWLKPTA